MDILLSVVSWFIGISFLLIMFPITFITWLIVLPFDRKRAVVHWMLVYQSIILSYIIPAWKVRIEGRKKLRKNITYVIIANHQSILDTILLNVIGLRFKWISKVETYRIPVIGWYLRMAGYITVDRNDDESKGKMLERSLDCLKNGTSIMIFPEGTRSRDLRIGFFKRGAFQLAINSGTPVLPVLIDGTGDILPKHGLMVRGKHIITIKIFDPVYPELFGTDDPIKIAEKFRDFMTERLEEVRGERREMRGES